MAKVAFDPFGSYPTQPTTVTVSPPSVSLAQSSDSGTLGDQITAYKNVRLEVGGLRSGGFAWLSKDGNATLDAVDIPVINGSVNVALNSGYNTFTFYQQDIPTGQVSLPSYYAVYLDPVAAQQQSQVFEATLNKMALAYLGRPLTSAEHQIYSQLLENSNGDSRSLSPLLAANPEFLAVYTVPDLKTGIERCYSILFGRTASAQEVQKWQSQVSAGTATIPELPRLIAESASGSDANVLAARLVFMQQANAGFDQNLAASGVSERTLLEVERGAVQSVMELGGVAASYESIAANASSLRVAPGSLPSPKVALDAASDDGVAGDFLTSLQTVKIAVSGLTPGALAWLDTNFNGQFDPAIDSPVINGSVYTNLKLGSATLVFHQMVNSVVSLPAYLTLRRGDAGTPLAPPDAPVLDLRSEDDDGGSPTDNATSKSLIRIDVSRLDPTSTFAWLERDGNGVYDPGSDITLTVGGASTTATVLLQEAGGDAVIAGYSAYQIRAGMQSEPGRLSVSYIPTGAGGETPGNVLAAPTPVLDPASDDGVKGDFETSLQSVKINVSGTATNGLAWLDSNYNGKFDPSTDTAVINGSVVTNLAFGSNTLVFYQTADGVTSPAAYLSLRRSDSGTPTTPPAAPALDLRAVDDDGLDNSDNVTTKSVVRVDISNLDTASSFAWVEQDGNGIYDAGKDVVIPTGAATSSVTLQLQAGASGSGIIGLSAYQVRAGLTSTKGSLSITYLKTIDVAKADGGSYVFQKPVPGEFYRKGTDSYQVYSGTVSLKFDRPVDWTRLDTNGDGKLAMGLPGTAGIELGVTMAGTFGFVVTNFPEDWSAVVPTYAGVYLTITDVWGTDTVASDATGLGVLLTGIPDVTNQVVSDAYWNIA